MLQGTCLAPPIEWTKLPLEPPLHLHTPHSYPVELDRMAEMANEDSRRQVAEEAHVQMFLADMDGSEGKTNARMWDDGAMFGKMRRASKKHRVRVTISMSGSSSGTLAPTTTPCKWRRSVIPRPPLHPQLR